MALTLLLSEVLSHCTHTEHDCLSHDLNTTQYVSKYVARAHKATDLGFPKKKKKDTALCSSTIQLQSKSTISRHFKWPKLKNGITLSYLAGKKWL